MRWYGSARDDARPDLDGDDVPAARDLRERHLPPSVRPKRAFRGRKSVSIRPSQRHAGEARAGVRALRSTYERTSTNVPPQRRDAYQKRRAASGGTEHGYTVHARPAAWCEPDRDGAGERVRTLQPIAAAVNTCTMVNVRTFSAP